MILSGIIVHFAWNDGPRRGVFCSAGEKTTVQCQIVLSVERVVLRDGNKKVFTRIGKSQGLRELKATLRIGRSYVMSRADGL